MAQPPKTWKAAERAVARLLNGRRCHFERQDVDAGPWAVEVKHGRQIPRTLLKWWAQTQANSTGGKTPMLVLHPHGTDYADSLALVRLADFARAARGGEGSGEERRGGKGEWRGEG